MRDFYDTRDAIICTKFSAAYILVTMLSNDVLILFLTDMRMFPMLECLSSVLSAIGLDAQQYVLQIYNRCLRIATTVLKEHADAGSYH